MKDVYERLAQALNKLPEGFPRAATGVELLILRKIFTPEEAGLGSRLTHQMETLSSIARRVRRGRRDVERRLTAMMAQGKVWGRRDEERGEWTYRMAPFIPGFYEEYIVATRDMEVLHLMWHYAKEGGLEIMAPRPALQRVIPAFDSVPPDEILPYDDVKELILAAKSFAQFDCTCRVSRDMAGDRPCSFPTANCLQMYYEERAPGPNTITRERALEILDESERLGLVHTGTNYMHGMHWICNCCPCCCNLIRNLVEEGLDGAIATSNYRAEVAPKACTGCEVCVERCPMGAIAMEEDRCAIDPARCFGCGVCATACDAEAITLRRKAPAELEHPPRDEAEFSHQRSHARGLR